MPTSSHKQGVKTINLFSFRQIEGKEVPPSERDYPKISSKILKQSDLVLSEQFKVYSRI